MWVYPKYFHLLIHLCCHFQGSMNLYSKSHFSSTQSRAPPITRYLSPLFAFPKCDPLNLPGLNSICCCSAQLLRWSILCLVQSCLLDMTLIFVLPADLVIISHTFTSKTLIHITNIEGPSRDLRAYGTGMEQWIGIEEGVADVRMERCQECVGDVNPTMIYYL